MDNTTLITWFSKDDNTVETSLERRFIELKAAVKLIGCGTIKTSSGYLEKLRMTFAIMKMLWRISPRNNWEHKSRRRRYIQSSWYADKVEASICVTNFFIVQSHNLHCVVTKSYQYLKVYNVTMASRSMCHTEKKQALLVDSQNLRTILASSR